MLCRRVDQDILDEHVKECALHGNTDRQAPHKVTPATNSVVRESTGFSAKKNADVHEGEVSSTCRVCNRL